jgi:hypothetical protein
VFENIDTRQIASLLWQIFMDTQRFFSMGINIRGNVPQSLLRTNYNKVAAGSIQAHLNVLYRQLMGQDPGEASYSNNMSQGTQTAMPSEGWTFCHVPPEIKAILRGARSKYPTVTVAEIMAAHEPPLQYGQIRLGPAGSWLS